MPRAIPPPPGSFPPDREDTGVHLASDLSKLDPDMARRVRLRLVENELADWAKWRAWAIRGVIAGALTFLVGLFLAAMHVGAKLERVDVDHEALAEIRGRLTALERTCR